MGVASVLRAACEAGISNHSSPAMLSSFTKKGQSFVSMESDSLASADEMGTGEDLITAVTTSGVGNARRFRVVGVVDEPATGAEKSLSWKDERLEIVM